MTYRFHILTSAIVYIWDRWLLYQLVYRWDSCLLSCWYWYQICFSSDVSHVMIFISYICSCLSVIQLCYICSCSYYYLCTLFFCTSYFPFYTHTHHGRVLTTLGLHVQILDGWFPLCRCSLRLYASRIAIASSYSLLVLLSFQSSYYFLLLVISVQFLFQLLLYYLIHMISCLVVYMWHCSIHFS